jgi:hypothetical protein
MNVACISSVLTCFRDVKDRFLFAFRNKIWASHYKRNLLLCCFGKLAIVMEMALHTHSNTCCVPTHHNCYQHTYLLFTGRNAVYIFRCIWMTENNKEVMNEHWLIFHEESMLKMVLPPTWFLFPLFYHKNGSAVKTLCSILQACFFVANGSYKAGLSHSHYFSNNANPLPPTHKQRGFSPTDLLWVTN